MWQLHSPPVLSSICSSTAAAKRARRAKDGRNNRHRILLLLQTHSSNVLQQKEARVVEQSTNTVKYSKGKKKPASCGGCQVRSKALDSGSSLVGVRGFESHPPHQFAGDINAMGLNYSNW